jgi:NADH:ubiquinone oxidoreductase subunit
LIDAMKQFLLQFFTWWNGQTLGTRFYTWRKGREVGTDEFGNRYYTDAQGKRRWVIYNGPVEASAIPAAWHGWMHHRTDDIPGKVYVRDWEKPPQPNLTGTPQAYRPPGSVLRPHPTTPSPEPDYEPWTP